ncbi:RagB/SusD family nutrient uptake outer membrane protein [Dysgonomonas sp. 520]|uniref:RagB/SusD family nutrient uptake outer membrane protein n=1 Tax=Dysgonomonas sp. 520 TaxID=2302931 RepID=UPI0013D36B72|nr:RagB/SusD family nutrient uptake outer membrane protein [Dysgonomonas sp. 520]NDW11125.1 RagB/SusD family nutrient uptake outer membrane protein [Dysgonomonas sp. 520]
MKNIRNIKIKSLIISGVIGTSLFFSACDDFLDEKEIPRITNEYYRTSQGVEAAATAAYGYLRFGVSGDYASQLLEMGNDIITGASGGVGSAYNIYDNNLSPSRYYTNHLWENHYKGINTANLVIQEVPNGDLSDDAKTAAIAEMKFMRAFFYFELVQQFGKIPLVEEASSEVRTEFKRAPVEDIYKLIISDLRYAAENLRETASASDGNFGKATRYSAAHLLSKAYLTRCSAVTEERGQRPTDADSALYYAKMVIDSDKYELLSNFADLWKPDNQRNKEVVFAVQFTEEAVYNGSGNLSHLYWNSNYDGIAGLTRDLENGRAYGFHRATNRTMFELFDRKNDSRFHKSFKWVRYANVAVSGRNPINIGDTAMYYSLKPKPADLKANYVYVAWDKDDVTKNNLYFPPLIKYMDPNRASVNETKGTRDWVRMRLGETYLLAAEAAGRKGDFETAAFYINELRKRAAWHAGEDKNPKYWTEEGGVYGDKSDTYEHIKVSASDISSNFVDFILDERGRELLGEHTRWTDLVRCEKLYEYIKERGYNLEAARNIKPFHKLRPIPQVHIDRLNPRGPIEEEQNEGYY